MIQNRESGNLFIVTCFLIYTAKIEICQYFSFSEDILVLLLSTLLQAVRLSRNTLLYLHYYFVYCDRSPN